MMAAAPSVLSGRNRVGSGLPSMLCVDEDSTILEGFRHQLRHKFDVHTAAGPQQGLEAVSRKGPFTLVVSDFQMSGMNGIEFLTKVRTIAPDSVRIMLTGQADFATAISAVNQCNIFRFLVKPCQHSAIEKALEAGLEQHKLIMAERQATEQILLGCVQALAEVMSIVQPEIFSQSNRVRRYIQQIADGLGAKIGWQIEAAAVLSHFGWMTLSPELLAKALGVSELSQEDAQALQHHRFAAAARILEKLPRLDQVVRIIERQQKPFSAMAMLDGADPVTLGAILLRAAVDFDRLRSNGLSHELVLQTMRRSASGYLPRVLDALANIERTEAQDEIRLVPLKGLRPGMIMEDELKNANGMLLLGKGQEVPASFVQRLGIYSYGLTPDFKCRVRVRPAMTSAR